MLASFAYTFNSKGQREQVEERIAGQIVRTIAYTYDAADRLIEEQMADTVTGARTITYTYDPVGNRLTKHDNGVMTTYTYDDNDRLLIETPLPGGAGGGLINYTYDNNGNMLSKAGNGEQMNLTYNALNQLIHTEMTITTGSTTMDYVYDHDGIRVGKTINGTDVFKYVVDTNRPYAQVLEEQRTQGALSATTNYIYGDDLLSRTTDGITHYYQYDGLGSTRALSDASGTLTDTYQYDAYGQLLNSTGANVNPYLYRGEQYDHDLSAYYLRARYYQPGIGRFLTTDPVEGFPNSPISLHRYVYAECNPVNMLDPSGEISLNEVLITGAIVSTLSAITTSQVEYLQDIYAEFVKDILPEAYVVGFNIAGTMPYAILSDLLKFISLFNGLAPVSLPIDPWVGLMSVGNGFVGFGAEALLSVGSAEAALFRTLSSGAAFALPTVSAGLELYDGFVYNLWNANDYKGPFESLTLNLDNFGGWSLFWDGNRGFDGPWGGARPFLSIGASLSFNLGNFSMGISHIDYAMLGEPDQSLVREDVVGIIITSILAAQFIKSIDKVNITPLAWGVLESSLWINTGVAHHFWNQKEPQYNIPARRNSDRRPDEYHSGPSYWIVSGL